MTLLTLLITIVFNLSADPQLHHNAYLRACDVSTHHSHQGKEVIGNNTNYTFAGENLAIGFDDRYFDILTAWIQSPTHLENLVGFNFTHFGVGKCNDVVVLITARQ